MEIIAPTAPTSISVIVCTLNRRQRLEHALASLAAQRHPLDDLEVIVVDNGSTDGTREVVERCRPTLPRLRYVEESRPGLSHARNRGIAEATGDIVAYLDDDALADAGWVSQLIGVWRSDLDVAAVGGSISVKWPLTRPAWMSPTLEAYFGRCDYGTAVRDLRFPEHPFGSNMAFPRALLARIGGFNPRLGIIGHRMMAAEETDLFLRLHRLGLRVAYCPQAHVVHWPPADRVTREWSLVRALGHGASNSLLQYINGDQSRAIWWVRSGRAVVHATLSAASTGVGFLARRDPHIVMSRLATTAYWAGFARGAASNAMGVTVEPAAVVEPQRPHARDM